MELIIKYKLHDKIIFRNGSRKIPPRKIRTQKIPTWNIPPHFIKCLSSLNTSPINGGRVYMYILHMLKL